MLNATINEREFQYIREWLRKYIGQDLAEDKQYFVQVNLNDILVKYELKSFAELIVRLEKHTPTAFNLSLQQVLKTAEPLHSRFIQEVVDSLMRTSRCRRQCTRSWRDGIVVIIDVAAALAVSRQSTIELWSFGEDSASPIDHTRIILFIH